MPIPDYDGQPVPGLAEALARIDAEHRLSLFAGHRRILRAGAAMDHMDDAVAWREVGLAVAEVARELRMTEDEVRRLTMPPHRHAIADALRLFRRS